MVEHVRGVGVAGLVAVWVVVATEVVFSVWSWFYLVTTDEGPGAVVTGVVDAVGGVSRVARPVAAILIVLWLWRARSNAERVPGRHRYGRGWAVWGWLPVVGLWVPRRVVADVWAACAPDGEPRAAVHRWWVLWLLYDLGGHAYFVLTLLTIQDPETSRTVVRVAAVLLPVFAAGAAVFLTVVVRRISGWQSVETVERVA
ncbi:hypothetical protein FHS29_000076 [Saccharothrix tamanrassetensis]|uniref:DUF4328 domain-containing protein n=1 Tax=Saccharothrix tamanrassetensis TaxID=1051531 RepID=A0A841CCM6_9PSEU|nr:DUF4328 domain-containing protein [Saccharothrix tamanrassetensis]MBB5953506.1 hypothetical protein [Saccharothrix tamanrassetensis]